jgi:hypothetical protein
MVVVEKYLINFIVQPPVVQQKNITTQAVI